MPICLSISPLSSPLSQAEFEYQLSCARFLQDVTIGTSVPAPLWAHSLKGSSLVAESANLNIIAAMPQRIWAGGSGS